MRAASHPARPLQGRRGVSTPVRTPPAPARQRTLDASPRCRDCRNLRVAASGDRLRWPALGSMLEGLSCAIAAHPGLGQRRSPIPARPGTPAVPPHFPPAHPPPRPPPPPARRRGPTPPRPPPPAVPAYFPREHRPRGTACSLNSRRTPCPTPATPALMRRPARTPAASTSNRCSAPGMPTSSTRASIACASSRSRHCASSGPKACAPTGATSNPGTSASRRSTGCSRASARTRWRVNSMSKQVTAKELAEIVTRLLTDTEATGELEGFDAFQGFMTDIAQVVCDHCGGEIRHSAVPFEDIWYVGIHGNASLPDTLGGIWQQYDKEGELFDASTLTWFVVTPPDASTPGEQP